MKKSIIGLSTLAVVIGAIGFMALPVLAYRGDPTVTGPNYTAERHEAMETAMEKLDYSAWKDLMNGRGRVTQVVNADNFAKFVEAHNFAEQGKITEANAIRAELGLGQGGHGAGRFGNR